MRSTELNSSPSGVLNYAASCRCTANQFVRIGASAGGGYTELPTILICALFVNRRPLHPWSMMLSTGNLCAM